MKSSKNQLPLFQSPERLNILIEFSVEALKCWAESWGIENIGVYFSGGKDSQVLLDMARRFVDPRIKAVFNQTGIELPQIVKHVRRFGNVVELRPKMPFHHVIEKYGWPVVSKEQAQFIWEYRNTKSEKLRRLRWEGRRDGPNKGRSKISECWKYLVDAPFPISHKCCDILKKNPGKRYEKQTGMKPIIGVMKGESQLRNQHGTTCNLYDHKTRPISKPMLPWNEPDIWAYIKRYNLKYCEAYDQGWDRTGCVKCMYGIHKDNPNRFQIIKKTNPELYDYCINKLGANKVLDFMGIKY